VATYHGKDGEVYVGGSICGEVVDFTYTSSSELADDTAKGDTSRSYLPGLKDGQTQLVMNFDPGDTQQNSLVEGASVTLALYPEDGKATGNVELTGTAWVESAEIGVPLGDKVTYNVTLKGYLTKGTAA